MKQLLLLRHAKTVPAGPGMGDHERTLMQRGRQDASAMGRYLKKQRLNPDLIVASTSQRTVETVELIVEQLAHAQRVEYLEALYLAEPEVIVSIIRRTPDSVGCLMVVGHNPGLERVATILAREPVKRKERDRLDMIEEKFPTAGLANLTFKIAKWRDTQAAVGTFVDFVRPRDL